VTDSPACACASNVGATTSYNGGWRNYIFIPPTPIDSHHPLLLELMPFLFRSGGFGDTGRLYGTVVADSIGPLCSVVPLPVIRNGDEEDLASRVQANNNAYLTPCASTSGAAIDALSAALKACTCLVSAFME
jgi:hypothetical protein